jgi:hypothetical protein
MPPRVASAFTVTVALRPGSIRTGSIGATSMNPVTLARTSRPTRTEVLDVFAIVTGKRPDRLDSVTSLGGTTTTSSSWLSSWVSIARIRSLPPSGSRRHAVEAPRRNAW